jgi:hypothetical protein
MLSVILSPKGGGAGERWRFNAWFSPSAGRIANVGNLSSS